MKPNYLEVPERMKESRILSKMSQEEACQQFAVTQSHYSKLEKGAKIISIESLKAFEKQGGDIDYLITGKHRYSGIVDEYVAKRTTVIGKVETVKLMLWLVRQGLILCEEETEILGDSWKYIRLMDSQKNDTIWERIREVEGISQEKMAEKLDINIKRYRKIEKLEVEPDAEILYSLYAEFGYSPQVILDQNAYCMNEINKIWDTFSEEIQMMLKRHLDYDVQLIRSGEEKIQQL